MAEMCLETAVPAPDYARKRYCLLRDDEIEAYRCAETAANLGATEEGTRLRAYWLHFKTHVGPYTEWALKKRLFDPTVRYPDPREGATELVEKVLLSFHRRVQEDHYDVERGPPCKYLKRAIKNGFQDILRRGRHPTREECVKCWEERGACPVFGVQRPWEQERGRCSRLPSVEGFDRSSALFAAAGLQEQWPPVLQDVRGISVVRRPVEDQALKGAMIACIWALMPELLTPDQQTVIMETYLHYRTSREIALMIQTTPGNVDQIRHRGLGRLYRALTS